MLRRLGKTPQGGRGRNERSESEVHHGRCKRGNPPALR